MIEKERKRETARERRGEREMAKERKRKTKCAKTWIERMIAATASLTVSLHSLPFVTCVCVCACVCA